MFVKSGFRSDWSQELFTPFKVYKVYIGNDLIFPEMLPFNISGFRTAVIDTTGILNRLRLYTLYTLKSE